MSKDARGASSGEQLVDISPQPPASASQPPSRNRLWRRLSTALIVVGILLLGAGGVMAYVRSAAFAEPPPPASLEDNPLPVVTGGDLPTVAVSYVTPTPTAPPFVPRAGTLEDVQDVPPGPPPTPTPTPIPPPFNPPARIVAPAINLDAEVVPIGWKEITQGGETVSVWEVAKYAAGWHENSSLPGSGGNIVFSGHHNIKGEVFRYLVDLEPGDTVTLYADSRPYTYTVESKFVVRDKGVSDEKRRENARWIGYFPDERVTLVTCWPYTGNTHRVIVIAKPTG